MITKEDTSKKLLMANVFKTPIDTVVVEKSSPGTYTIEIPENGVYEIYCIAPGGESIATDANNSLYATAVEG